MFKFYIKDKTKYIEVSKKQGEEANKTENLYIKITGKNYIARKMNNDYEQIKFALPKHTLYGDVAVIVFDTNIKKVSRTAKLEKTKFKNFINLCLGDTVEYIPVGNVFNEKGLVIEDIKIYEPKILKESDLSFYCELSTRLFKSYKNITDYDEVRKIEMINENENINDIAKVLDVNMKNIYVIGGGRYAIDKNTSLKYNKTGQPFEFVEAVKQNRTETMKYFSKDYDLGGDFTEKVVVVDEKKQEQIIFKTDGVSIIKYVNGERAEKMLVDTKFDFIGFANTKYDVDSSMMSDVELNYYIIKSKTETVFVKRQDCKSMFNRAYFPKYNIFFHGTDSEMSKLYKALDILKRDGKEFDIITVNGINKKYNAFIHGGKLVFDDTEQDNKFFIKSLDYKLDDDKKKITVKTLGEYIRDIYNHAKSSMAYLWFIGAMMASLFKDKGVKIPFLFISGESSSGKTFLIECLFQIFNFYKSGDEVIRKFFLSATTPQPIAVAGTDESILWLEEYTGIMKKGVDDIIRNLYDNGPVSKGTLHGNNKYIMKAPTVITGEAASGSQSIINRSIFMLFYKHEKKGSEEFMDMIDNVSVLNDWWDKIQKIGFEGIDKIIDEYKKKKVFPDNRINSTYSFILMVNKIFDIYDEEDVIKYCEEIYTEQMSYISSIDETKQVITKVITENKRFNSTTYREVDGDLIIEMLVPDSIERDNKTRHLFDAKKKYGIPGSERNGNEFIVSMNQIKGTEIEDLFLRFLKKERDIVVRHRLDSGDSGGDFDF